MDPGDDDGSITALSEPDGEYYDIDPLEKEWMVAAAMGDMESMHRLLMTDPSLVNRKDFIHGYTALHWAAKKGRVDIIVGMMMNGGSVHIKSVGIAAVVLSWRWFICAVCLSFYMLHLGYGISSHTECKCA